MKINDLSTLSEGLQYHVSNGLPLSENIFRPGSEEFFRLIEEARIKFNNGEIDLDWFDQELINTDIGTIVELANGEEVPLDIPFFENEYDAFDIMYEDPPIGIDFDFDNLPKVDWSKYSKEDIEKFVDHLENLDFEDGVDVSNTGYSGSYRKAANWVEKNVLAKRQNESEELEEIWGFSAGNRIPAWKRGTIKKKKEKFEPTLQQKLAAKRRLEKAGKPSSWDDAKREAMAKINEAEYQGKTVELNKPKRGGSKKFYVYTKNKKGNVVKVSFGDTTGLSVKANDPGRVASFVARHDCKNKNDRTKASYWSCRLPRYKSLGIKGGQWW